MDPMKRCSTCHRLQPRAEFNVRRAAVDGLQSRCRTCSRTWYRQNATEHKRNVRARTVRERVALRQRVADHLLEHPCVDCGEADVQVLEFDHRDPTQKLSSIARLLIDLHASGILAAEIDKCDVRCANCHRRRSMEAAGAWRVEVERERRRGEQEEVTARLWRVLPAHAPGGPG